MFNQKLPANCLNLLSSHLLTSATHQFHLDEFFPQPPTFSDLFRVGKFGDSSYFLFLGSDVSFLLVTPLIYIEKFPVAF
jgi:hypothetical protein